MNLEKYEHFELHMSDPRVVCIFERCEFLGDLEDTILFYNGSPLKPLSSLYVKSRELYEKHIVGKTYILKKANNYQLLAKAK